MLIITVVNIVMKIDTRLTPVTALLIAICCAIPFTVDLHVPLYQGKVVSMLENTQALWLLFGVIFTLCAVRRANFSASANTFWKWSALWWLVLLGRSVSWGRDYFPAGPRLVFRLISVALIGALVLSLFFSATLRKEIVERLRNSTLLLWTFVLTAASFLISDSVEHHRLIAPLFLHDRHYQDLIEELYEFPFMIGLFCVSYDLMKREYRASQFDARENPLVEHRV